MPMPITLEVAVAWGDMDAFQHVNNVVYLRWFESARIALFERAGMLERMEREKIGPILARNVVDYRLPLKYPDVVRVEAGVARLGTSSFTLAYRATSTRSGAVAAEGESVIVMIDYGDGRKIPLDEGLRARLSGLSA